MNERITIQENNLTESYLFYFLINLCSSTRVMRGAVVGLQGHLEHLNYELVKHFLNVWGATEVLHAVVLYIALLLSNGIFAISKANPKPSVVFVSYPVRNVPFHLVYPYHLNTLHLHFALFSTYYYLTYYCCCCCYYYYYFFLCHLLMLLLIFTYFYFYLSLFSFILPCCCSVAVEENKPNSFTLVYSF